MIGTLTHLEEIFPNLAAVGYRQLSLIRLKDDEAYLAIFEPPTLASRPRPSQIHACKG